jgi:hypothetical protein
MLEGSETEGVEENPEEKYQLFSNEHETNFRDAVFIKPETVIFKAVNLSHASFLNVEVIDVRFFQVNWESESDKRERIRIYDERETNLQGEGKRRANLEKRYSGVSSLYKQLRVIYEGTGDYFRAGDFFFGEMEMRKKEHEEGLFIRLVLFIYRTVSAYGERPVIALRSLILVWLLFGAVYENIKLVPIDDHLARNYEYFRGVILSFSNLTLGKVETSYVPANAYFELFLKGAEIIFGVVVLSLFLLAMNRKFRRTKD